MIGRMHGVSPIINGPGLGLNTNPESDQFRNLIVHLPLMECQTSLGFPRKFKDTKRDYAGWVFDGAGNFSVAKHPTRPFFCPRLFGNGAGNSSSGIGVGMNTPGPVFTYGSNSKTHKNPPRLTVTIWTRINTFTNFLTSIVGEKTVTYSSPYNNWMMRVLNTGVAIWDCTDGTAVNIGQMSSPAGVITTGKDYLWGLTIDGTKLRGYINGVEIMSQAFTAPIGQLSSSLTIGNNPQQLFASESLNGYVWDYRMYNRALSPLEHFNLYDKPYDLYKQSPRQVRVSSLGVVVPITLTQSFSATDSLSKTVESHRSLTQSFTTSHTYGRVFAQSLTQSFSTSDSITKTVGGYRLINVTQSFAVSQTVVKRLAKYFAISHSMAMAQVASSNVGAISHDFTVTQTISFTKVINLSVAQSFSPSDALFIQSPRRISLNHNLICSQSVAGRNATTRLSISQSIGVTDTVFGRNATTRISVVHSFSASHNVIIRDAVITISLSNSITMTHRVNTQYNLKLIHDINVADTIIAHRHIYRTFSTTTDIVDDFTSTRTLNRTFSTQVNEESTIQRNVIYKRSLSTIEHLAAQEFHPAIQFNTRPFYLPDISGGPPQFGLPTTKRSAPTGIDLISNTVRIESGGNVLLLPTPQLSNPLSDAIEVTTKRSITGELAAYKKTTGQERFSYTFWLDRAKAFEVRAWVKTYGSAILKITNWRGEAWQGNLITDQPSLNFDAVRIGPAGEKVVITLEFQGVRLYG